MLCKIPFYHFSNVPRSSKISHKKLSQYRGDMNDWQLTDLTWMVPITKNDVGIEVRESE